MLETPESFSEELVFCKNDALSIYVFDPLTFAKMV